MHCNARKRAATNWSRKEEARLLPLRIPALHDVIHALMSHSFQTALHIQAPSQHLRIPRVALVLSHSPELQSPEWHKVLHLFRFSNQ